MSMKADIDDVFNELVSKHPNIEGDILDCKFGVYESLEWDDSASEVIKEKYEKGFDITKLQRAYL